MADDLGYGEPGCYGSPDARTPKMDRLAAEGELERRARLEWDEVDARQRVREGLQASSGEPSPFQILDYETTTSYFGIIIWHCKNISIKL